MRFVIMADGKGIRWNNHLGIPKHLAEINGEPIIYRTVRLLRDLTDGEIIVTSHDERYEFKGSRRHEPLNNRLEIDRFTEELIEDDICFLYGDTYYTESALKTIICTKTEDMIFFGNSKSIVAVKVTDSELFRYHLNRVKQLYISGKLQKCKGWQVYQSFVGQSFEEKPRPGGKFVLLDETTTDINTPEEYEVI